MLLCGYEDISNRRFRSSRKIGTREPSVPDFSEKWEHENLRFRVLRKLERKNRRSRVRRSLGTREPSVPEFYKNRKEGTAESGFFHNRSERTAGLRLFPRNVKESAVLLKEPEVINRSVLSEISKSFGNQGSK